MKNEEYIDINKVAKAKGLKSTRSIRIAIQKGKYEAREVTVFGGKSYEILYSSLEPEIQEKLEDEEMKCTALVPLNNKPQAPSFMSDRARMTALARVDVVNELTKVRSQYKTKKEADATFLELYNSGLLLPVVYKFLGSISVGTLHRWLSAYEETNDYRALIPGYKVSKQNEYNSILNDEMKQVFLKFLLHPNKFSLHKAVHLTKSILEKRGYTALPCDLSFKSIRGQ